MRGRKIIVGVSGSIAAYKSVLLVRLLVKAGAEVQVLMTPAAAGFVSPLTFATLSHRSVLTSVISGAGWNNHVELGLWADAYVIAPATANTLARLANGICDSILAAVYLSARCPVLFAPAMDLDMWAHPSTVRNVERLQGYGNTLIPVGEGELASGLSGAGRLAEPADIVAALERTIREPPPDTASPGPTGTLGGKTVLVTAGPTHEPIDPVRFIGNHSSGKMGLALTEALLARGARVVLVLGPTGLRPATDPRLELVSVTTAAEMHAACLRRWPAADAGVMAAAVADYRPREAATQKIKKGTSGAGGEGPCIELVRNPDIAAELGASKRPGQILLGFALETERGLDHARQKLVDKHLDAIALNLHTPEASAFGGDVSAITLLGADNSERALGLLPKREAAGLLADAVADLLERALKTKR